MELSVCGIRRARPFPMRRLTRMLPGSAGYPTGAPGSWASGWPRAAARWVRKRNRVARAAAAAVEDFRSDFRAMTALGLGWDRRRSSVAAARARDWLHSVSAANTARAWGEMADCGP